MTGGLPISPKNSNEVPFGGASSAVRTSGSPGAVPSCHARTAAVVTPIRELDNRKIGNGGRGPVTEKLQTLYFDQVHGRRPALHPEWLTRVYD